MLHWSYFIKNLSRQSCDACSYYNVILWKLGNVAKLPNVEIKHVFPFSLSAAIWSFYPINFKIFIDDGTLLQFLNKNWKQFQIQFNTMSVNIKYRNVLCDHCDVIMTTMASQITSLTVVYSIVYSGADQRKHHSSASLAGNSSGHRCKYWIVKCHEVTVTGPGAVRQAITGSNFNPDLCRHKALLNHNQRTLYKPRTPIMANSRADIQTICRKWLEQDIATADTLTHWGRNKMADIFRAIFSNAFSWMKIYEFWSKFHRSLLIRSQSTIFQHWFR